MMLGALRRIHCGPTQLTIQDPIESMTRYLTTTLVAAALAAGCSKEPPPTSVNEFLDQPILLEAAMVRCSEDRTGTRYEAECVNAREAVSRISVKEEAARKAEMDARSDAKRNALRRTQRAAAESRRRTADAMKRREEAEYLAQFGVVPADGNDAGADMKIDSGTDNSPVAVLPEQAEPEQNLVDYGQTEPATDGGNAPAMAVEPPEEESVGLNAIREELQRRREEEGVD